MAFGGGLAAVAGGGLAVAAGGGEDADDGGGDATRSSGGGGGGLGAGGGVPQTEVVPGTSRMGGEPESPPVMLNEYESCLVVPWYSANVISFWVGSVPALPVIVNQQPEVPDPVVRVALPDME